MTQAQFSEKYGRAPSHEPLVAPSQTQQPKSLLDTIGGAAQGVSNFIGAKGITDLAGSQLAKLGLSATGNLNAASKVEEPSPKEVFGSAMQTGAMAIPGLGEAGLLAKTGAGLATGYAMDVGSKLQNNTPNPLIPGVATAVGGIIPGAGAVAKPAAAIVGRLFKGLGSELSGVSSKTIDQILNNPKAAQKAAQLINKTGQSNLLEENAKTIVNGIAGLKKEAGANFGKALEGLKAEDINPATFRQNIQPVLDKVGSSVKEGVRNFDSAGFSDPKNVQKASELVDRLNILPKGKMDGATLRKLADDIESAKYKVGSSDERLSFNAFLQDLSSGVKKAINASTDKLGEANQAFSHDMQLAQTAEGEFGKVKFKNLPEIVKASKQIESLFQKKGIAPEKINDFLTRIGVSPSEFNAGEAVRQIGSQEGGKNSVGTNVSEMLRGITSAVVTPKMVGTVATLTGLAHDTIEPFLKGLATPARNAVLQALLQAQNSTQQQEPQGTQNQ